MPFTQPWLEVNFGTAYAGLVGTVGYRLYQNNDTDSVARTTAGIVEIGTNTGCYGVVPPSIPDNAVGIEWDTGGGSPVSAVEDLEPYRRRAVVEGKLPTNYIMGSSDQADHDGEIGEILTDTADMQPKLGTPAGADMSADIAAIQADTDDIQTRLPAALVGGRMDSHVGSMAAGVISSATFTAGAIDAAAIATDAIDADAIAADAIGSSELAATAVTEIQSAILSDATPFPGANIDAQISTRATQAQILSDATPFQGARIDAAISSRSSHTAADVDTVLSAAHGAGSWLSAVPPAASAIATAVWNEALPGAFAGGTAGNILGNRLDVVLSTRSSHTAGDVDTQLSGVHGAGSWATATGFAVAGDAMTLTAGERTTLSGVVDTTLVAAHGAGSWQTATGFAVAGDAMTLTPAERTTLTTVIDAALILAHGAGNWTTATGFAVAGDAMTLTAGERTAVATEVDVVLSAAHGAGSWLGVAASIPAIVSAIWSEALPGAYGAGTAGERLGAMSSTIADDTSLVRKYCTNQLDSLGGDPGTHILRDDDGSVLLTQYIRDHLGAAAVLVDGAPAQRTKAA